MFNVSVSAALTLNDKLRGELLLLATRLTTDNRPIVNMQEAEKSK